MEDGKRVMAKIRARIKELGLSDVEAARDIGVTSASLARHLDGAYVRSDSLAKYRSWLAGEPVVTQRKSEKHSQQSQDIAPALPEQAEPLRLPGRSPRNPYRVVDLFGGCGGLSLGFELAGNGELFRTVLAIDIEEPMVRVFNANHPPQIPGVAIGRQADLSEFLNEAEVLAYYLDHLSTVEADQVLAQELEGIQPIGLRAFVRLVMESDAAFLARLSNIRSSEVFNATYGRISKNSFSQTSVLGFHKALKLPQPGSGSISFDPPLWGRSTRTADGPTVFDYVIPEQLMRECRNEARDLWSRELEKLRERAEGSGSGQLASAATKIRETLELIDGEAYEEVKVAWLQWRERRDALRRSYFENEQVLAQLREIYRDERKVDVLLGGPPCQGFSRIGRGKIRSLREQSVHVHADAKAGDKRNELMLQYVLFVAALSPATFLFENVRHFQAEVKTPEGTFKATDILAESIANISHDGLEYGVSSRVLFATEHLVPQTRERFFMVGIRQDVVHSTNRDSPAAWCLSLPRHAPVALKNALAGLPEPVHISASPERAGGTDTLVAVEDFHVHGRGAVGKYLEWIRQAPPKDRPNHDHLRVDGHCARDSRSDDRAFFEMLGPGKRWMDYRCDGNPLLDDLKRVLEWVVTENNLRNGINGVPTSRLLELLDAADGSFSLRLLLDRIPLGPGEVRHHLSAPNYLKKKEGNHGDWLARLDAESPCKTMVSHMGKDTYAYIHPSSPRTISVREAARVQTFPDWYQFGCVGLVDGYRVIGNAVPPLLSSQLALRVAVLLEDAAVQSKDKPKARGGHLKEQAAPLGLA